MSDRELLELAAKAAGIEYKHENKDWKHDDHCAFWSYDDLCTCGARWNPRDDDGDALRLACDLGLRVYPIARTSSGAACSAVASVTCHRLSEVADASIDTRAATRRAIVRAAAEIGRNMK